MYILLLLAQMQLSVYCFQKQITSDFLPGFKKFTGISDILSDICQDDKKFFSRWQVKYNYMPLMLSTVNMA